MLGRWDDCLIDPAYYIEDCQISSKRRDSGNMEEDSNAMHSCL